MENKGFTLIELLVVVSIISLLSMLTLANFRAGESQLGLQRSSHKLAQDIRKSQEMAISAKEFQGTVPKGYGIYLNGSQPNQYVLFADLDGGKDYDAGEGVETLTFENQIKIKSLSPSSPLTVVFSPPDPTVSFSYETSTVAIVIEAGISAPIQKTIKVNKAGLVSIE